jgi:hypothetical protein
VPHSGKRALIVDLGNWHTAIVTPAEMAATLAVDSVAGLDV